eukprot:14232409-Alexandrium_andersonii.AAC.1
MPRKVPQTPRTLQRAQPVSQSPILYPRRATPKARRSPTPWSDCTRLCASACHYKYRNSVSLALRC